MKIQTYKDAGKPIVYIDESGFATDMPRTHGVSPRGKRCYGRHDWHAKGRKNVIGACLNNQLLTVGVFEGNINSDVFHAWLTQELLPKAPQGAVIVMDNASFHHRKAIQQAIREADKQLEYLPPYSPDFNPIEKKWAQAKALRRKRRCNVESLFSAALF